jgi:preprotein translocase subunit SecD
VQQSITDGQSRSRVAIFDGNMSTWLIGIVLYLMGTNVFKWFGAMMVINTILILLYIVPLTGQLLMYMMSPENKEKKALS